MADRDEDDAPSGEAVGVEGGAAEAAAPGEAEAVGGGVRPARDAGDVAAPAAEEHEPVACPNEGCGAPPGTSYPWASDSAALIELSGKCIGCNVLANEMTDELRNQALALAAERGVHPEQAIQRVEMTVEEIIVMMAEQIAAQGEMLRRQGREMLAIRLGVGALLELQTGGTPQVPEPILQALGVNVDEKIKAAESAKVRESLAVDIPPGFNPRQAKGPIRVK